MNDDKPTGAKAYGHIGHLPGSRQGPGDHAVHEGQARIATFKARDRHDHIYVQEKLDGSCVSVAKVNGELIPLGRAGYRAISSPFVQHVLFHDWAMARWARFDALLSDGERVVGEWLAQAHGTRYDFSAEDREPFVTFDLMRGSDRLTVAEFSARTIAHGFWHPVLLAEGPTSIEAAMSALGTFGHYGAIDPVEGCVWRVERDGKVDFLAKYVRPDKVDGSYLESLTGGDPVWNWRPGTSAA